MTLYNEAPPVYKSLHDRHHSVLGFPQTHAFGTSLICQSYLRWTASASLNSLLLRFKSISFTGMTVSQLEAPFSAARSTALLVFSGRELLRSSNLWSSLTFLYIRMVNCKDLIRSIIWRFIIVTIIII